MKIEEEIGKKYGRLTIISLVEKVEYFYKWKTWQYNMNCLCECGNTTIVNLNSIRQGRSKSCGCYNSERSKENHKTHGLCFLENGKRRPEYEIWKSMRARCNRITDKKYKDYGGRGIKISEEWEKFEQFYKDMGDKPGKEYSIDRIDNEKGYCKENCKWSTQKEQGRNQRTNVIVEYQGRSQCIAAWADELNIPYRKLRAQVANNKWPR